MSKNQQDRVFIGRTSGFLKLPVFIPGEVRRSHMLLVGMTGSGKTTSLRTLILQDVNAKKSVLIVDGKGDLDLISHIKRDKKYILFSSSPVGNCTFNPLLGETHEVINNFFIACAEKFEQPYFRELARSLMTGYLLLAKYYGEKPSFTDLSQMASDIEPFRENITAVDDIKIRRIFSSVLEMKVKDYRQNHSGLAAVLSNIVASPWISFLESRDDLPELNIDELGQEEPAFQYVGLQKLSNLESSGLVGRLLLLKLSNLSERRAATGIRPKYNDSIHAFVDELHGVAFLGMESLIQTARSSRIAMTFATQTLSDLNCVSPDFKQQILTNTACKIVHLQNSAQDAEAWAKHYGDESFLKKTGKGLGFLSFLAGNPFQATGMPQRKEERVWSIEPNTFKNLKRGEAIIEIIYPTKKVIKKVNVAAVS
ncbi:MAG: type IV secretion system DNA-binding domain-containing protein [bacterium]